VTVKPMWVKKRLRLSEEDTMRVIFLAGLTALTLAACSRSAPDPIRDFGSATISQFERDVVSQKELSLPPTFGALPQPVLGTPNRADP